MKTIWRLYDLRTNKVVEEFEPWLEITTLDEAIAEIGGKWLRSDPTKFVLDDEVLDYEDFEMVEEEIR